MLCSVVKDLGSDRALKKWGKTLDCVSCFPLHFLRALPLPAYVTTEQSTVEAFNLLKCSARTFRSESVFFLDCHQMLTKICFVVFCAEMLQELSPASKAIISYVSLT